MKKLISVASVLCGILFVSGMSSFETEAATTTSSSSTSSANSRVNSINNAARVASYNAIYLWRMCGLHACQAHNAIARKVHHRLPFGSKTCTRSEILSIMKEVDDEVNWAIRGNTISSRLSMEWILKSSMDDARGVNPVVYNIQEKAFALAKGFLDQLTKTPPPLIAPNFETDTRSRKETCESVVAYVRGVEWRLYMLEKILKLVAIEVNEVTGIVRPGVEPLYLAGNGLTDLTMECDAPLNE